MKEREGVDMKPDEIRDALSGVGFPDEFQKKLVQELSGGWRMRLLIATVRLRATLESERRGH